MTCDAITEGRCGDVLAFGSGSRLAHRGDSLLVSSEGSLENGQCFLGSGLLLYALREAQHTEHQAREPLTPVQRGVNVPAPRSVAPTRWQVRRAALVARAAVSSRGGHHRDPATALRRAERALFGLRPRPVQGVTVEIRRDVLQRAHIGMSLGAPPTAVLWLASISAAGAEDFLLSRPATAAAMDEQGHVRRDDQRFASGGVTRMDAVDGDEGQLQPTMAYAYHPAVPLRRGA